MNQPRVLVGLSLVAATLCGLPLAAQHPAPQRVDVAKLGPQVGQRVPEFSLTDQNGTTHTLRSIIGPKGAMLVFVRSADW